MKQNLTPDKIANFIQIPYKVLYDKNLSYMEKILFGLINALSKKRGYCYARNQYLADELSCSCSTITNGIKKLNAEGYIDISNPLSFSRQIRVVALSVTILEPDVLENSEEGAEAFNTTSERIQNKQPGFSQHKREGKIEHKTIKENEMRKSKRLPFRFSSLKEKEIQDLLANNLLPLQERMANFFDEYQDLPFSVNSLFDKMTDCIQLNSDTCKVLDENTFEDFLCIQLDYVIEHRKGQLKEKKDDSNYYPTGDTFTAHVKQLAHVLKELLEFDLNSPVHHRSNLGTMTVCRPTDW